jgi:hypothetical protein
MIAHAASTRPQPHLDRPGDGHAHHDGVVRLLLIRRT